MEEISLSTGHVWAGILVGLIFIAYPVVNMMLDTAQTSYDRDVANLVIQLDGTDITELDMFPTTLNTSLNNLVSFSNPSSKDFSVRIKVNQFPMNLNCTYSISETQFIIPPNSVRNVQFFSILHEEPKNRQLCELYAKFIVKEE